MTPEDEERALTVLREQRMGFKTVDRAVQEGDIAVINFKGSCEGKPITDIAPTAKGLTEKSNFWLEVGKKSFIPGFDEQLTGAKAGEKRTVNVDFPADFVTPQLAARRAFMRWRWRK